MNPSLSNKTWFLITDRRLIRLNFYGEIVSKNLSELSYFEIRKTVNGAGDLLLGKYRYPPYTYSCFDYEKGYKDFMHERDKYFQEHDKFLMDYFHFFALEDVDTSARIIRERTNAKEYIDPKRKK